MAKSTHSQEVVTGTSDSYTSHELSDPDPMPRRAMLGDIDRSEDVDEEGESPSVGISSHQSSESAPSLNESQTPDHQQLAQMTESPSGQNPETELGSSAHSTDGSGQKAETRPSGRKNPPVKPATQQKKGARATVMGGAEDEFDEFL